MKSLKQQAIGEKKLIISLTSFPARINAVHKVIKRLLNQRVQPDKVLLFLATPQFPNQNDDLPKRLIELAQKDPRFEIRFLERDTRQFKKLAPALKEFPNDYIITTDDDTLYRRNLISKLLARSIQYPNAIVAGRVRFIKLDKNKNPRPYKKWWSYTIFANWFRNGPRPRFRNLAIGMGGVLYPPNCLHQDVLSDEIFEQSKPQSEDLWHWTMAVRAGTKIAVARPYWFMLGTRGSQKEALWRTHRSKASGGKSNKDFIIEKILKEHPGILEKLQKEGRAKC